MDKIDARGSVCGHRPGGGHSPCTAIDKMSRRILKAGWLALREFHRRLNTSDEASSVPAVKPHTINIHLIAAVAASDFEIYGLTGVHTDIRCESHEIGVVKVNADIPLAGWVARKAVLSLDRVCGVAAT